MTLVKMPIDGLRVELQKVVGDSRGLLAELLPGGARDPAVAEFGIGNLYASIATGRHVARAGHFHFKNHENFFTLTGVALWLFHDFRENSPTFGVTAGLVLGAAAPETAVQHPQFVLTEKQMARVGVPVGVYHAYWPLTDEKVVVVAAASDPHNDADYDRRPPAEVPGFREELAKYGIAA